MSIKEKVKAMIAEKERGSILFLQDFMELGDAVGVRAALCSLVAEKELVRLARGIYCRPQFLNEYGVALAFPSPETIAEAVARKENIRIIPYGDQAACRLGLSTFRISDLKYLTDGAPRVLKLAGSRAVYFNHTSEVKIFAYKNRMMQDLAMALRALGAEYFEDEWKRRRISALLRNVPDDEFRMDIVLPPAWVGKILTELRDR
ncbi:MAG: hypothetical protein HUJ94_08340 [Bacteroidales bacterium]|nr:hypothetical protein [Bacteroidales bacterium]